MHVTGSIFILTSRPDGVGSILRFDNIFFNHINCFCNNLAIFFSCIMSRSMFIKI